MERLLKVISFLILLFGLFKVLNISFIELAEDIAKNLSKEKTDIKSKIKKQSKKNKGKGIRKIVDESKSILGMMGKEEKISLVWIISSILFITGTVVSISLGNLFLIPILSIGLGLVPFWFVIYNSNSYKRQINEELETALSTITTSYIRSEDIILAVEENIDYLNPPISQVFIFFLSQTKLITSNTKLAIENLRSKIQNEIFEEWCNALIACQDNKNLKTTLVPILTKLSDTRIVSGELDNMLFEPMKEFLTMVILLIANIPLIRVLNKDWYDILMHTPIGHGILAICILVIFISLGAVIRLTRPIEYKS